MNYLETIRPRIERRISRERETLPPEAVWKRLKDLSPARDFAGALKRPGTALIAEIKRASPSSGTIQADCRPGDLARLYQRAGAAAVSVLTEPEDFDGRLDDLSLVRRSSELPVLRKDFIIDGYQVLQARLFGADAFLLIAEMLGKKDLAGLISLGRELGMASLVEAHDDENLEKAVAAGAEIIGINNRDLKTLKVDLEAGLRLLPRIPEDRIRVSESGISGREDIERLKAAGADAFLVGGAILKADDPETKIRELRGE